MIFIIGTLITTLVLIFFYEIPSIISIIEKFRWDFSVHDFLKKVKVTLLPDALDKEIKELEQSISEIEKKKEKVQQLNRTKLKEQILLNLHQNSSSALGKELSDEKLDEILDYIGKRFM